MNGIENCIEHNVSAVWEDTLKMVVYGFLSYHGGYLQIPNHELMEKYQRVLSRDRMGR